MSINDIFDRLKSAKTPSGAPEYILAGLGNPGKKHENTRHNAGFRAIDYVSDKLGVKITKSKFNALVGNGEIGGKNVLFMKPQTMMNASGVAISEAANFYKIPVQNIIVLCDDISIDPGKIRVRRKGSDGGQRGLRSIIGLLGSEDVPRVKIGVGERPSREYDLADWVLGQMSDADTKATEARYPDVYSAIELIIGGDIDKAMNLCN